MQHPHPAVQKAFVAAGAVTTGGLAVLTLGLTNQTLFHQNPQLSEADVLVIALHGLAYIAVARSYHLVPWLVLLFAAECWLVLFTWVQWLQVYGTRLGALWSADPLSGAYYTLYGPIDLVIGAFFLWVFASLTQEEKERTEP